MSRRKRIRNALLSSDPGEYEELEGLLAAAGAMFGVAEAHGTMVGLLAAGGVPSVEHWIADTLNRSFSEQVASTPLGDSLRQLQIATWRALAGSGMEFVPLLPSDNASLSVRARGLADWVSGFMYGLTVAGIASDKLTSPEAQEVLADFAEISKADGDDEEDEVGADFAYAELVEYVRVGAQLLYDEFEVDRESQGLKPH